MQENYLNVAIHFSRYEVDVGSANYCPVGNYQAMISDGSDQILWDKKLKSCFWCIVAVLNDDE